MLFQLHRLCGLNEMQVHAQSCLQLAGETEEDLPELLVVSSEHEPTSLRVLRCTTLLDDTFRRGSN
jgi:hypothetical protein